MAQSIFRVPIGAVFHDEVEDGLLSILTYATMKNNYNHPNQVIRLETRKGIIRADSLNGWALTKLACELLKDGVFTLLGTADRASQNAFASLSDRMQVPFISWLSAESNEAYGRFELRMKPQKTDAIGDFILLKQWQSFTFLYDSLEGLSELENLQAYLSSKNMKVNSNVIYLRKFEPDYFRFFLSFHASLSANENHVILHVRSRLKLKFMLRDLLDAAAKTRNVHYLIAGQEVPEHEVEKFKTGLMNVSAFQYINRQSKFFGDVLKGWNQFDQRLFHRLAVNTITAEEALVFDSMLLVTKAFEAIAKKNATLLTRHFHHEEFWNDDYRGLLCFPKEDRQNPERQFVSLRPGPLIYETLKKIKFQGLTGNVQFDASGRRTHYSLGLTEVEFSGIWRGSVKLQNEPFFMLKKDADLFTGNDKYEGFCVDLMKLVSEKIGNLPYVVKPVKDNKYGTVDLDGRWDGMVGELITGAADLAVASLTINTLRERVVDFSKPFLTTGISIMIKKPDKQEISIFSFMQPLSAEVWLFITIACCGVSIVLYLISRFNPYEWSIGRYSAYGVNSLSDFTFDNCLWVSLAAVMQQGTDIMPRSVACRIANSIWWFFTMIIVSSYTANLAAFLTLEKMHAPIESVEDLAKQNKIRYGIQASGSTAQFFKESKVEVHRRMWQYMISQTPSVLVADYAEGIRRVRESKGEYAFLLEATANEYAGTRKPCDTMKVGMNLNTIGYGIATPFNSDLGEKINLAILELQEIGELKRLEMKWWYEKGQCDQGISDSQSASLTLSKVAGIFYILSGGMILAMLYAFIEAWHKLRKEKSLRVVC
ncbi:glutamate receptor 1 [Trichuris trichiura]|uniref:Glutamate receptor 1 n=1 Tax=Trichuris trichiura TaxID=36087 RepID=A0A077Z8K1_TRITR|nr:glutamate receptor 1 [Trichuris trichiura]